MFITGIEVSLRLFEVYSLKEKRSITKSIVDKMHRKYNISSAEVDEMDNLNKAVVGFAVVSNNHRLNDKVLQNVLNDIDKFYEAEIVHTDWIDY